MEVYSRLVKPNAPSAKKRFGQHFLRDTGVVDRIVRWIQPGSDDAFFEIGAGDGALSRQLAPSVLHYIALEIDDECIPPLRESLIPYQSAAVVQGDFLQLDLTTFLAQHFSPDMQVRVVGNLPYNIATVIIERLLHHAQSIRDMHFMIQLEVARRITAGPGTKDYGFFSVYCQHHAAVQLGFKVSPACFVPRPKVNSSMVAIRPRRRELNPDFEAAFDEVVKAAFSYRRKTLSNSLARHSGISKIAELLLSQTEIDGSVRAEDLSVSEYERLASTYFHEFRNQK
jgi:16S rRNA (adenine1518-N6/adenine1519-N6)-dimethyltransferase